MTLVKEVIAEVEKHHKMKMSEKCVERLLEILKSHCPHYQKQKGCANPNCDCDPCTCDPCEC